MTSTETKSAMEQGAPATIGSCCQIFNSHCMESSNMEDCETQLFEAGCSDNPKIDLDRCSTLTATPTPTGPPTGATTGGNPPN